MPARRIECPECGWVWSTFRTDEEICKEGMKCPRCSCPILLELIQEMNKPRKTDKR